MKFAVQKSSSKIFFFFFFFFFFLGFIIHQSELLLYILDMDLSSNHIREFYPIILHNFEINGLFEIKTVNQTTFLASPMIGQLTSLFVDFN